MFFIGYFLLEIPGTLIVEKWSAAVDLPDHAQLGHHGRLTAFVKTPFQFYLVRFLLGWRKPDSFRESLSISRTGSPPGSGAALSCFLVATRSLR